MNISNRRLWLWWLGHFWMLNKELSWFSWSTRRSQLYSLRQDIAALGVVAVALVVCLAAWQRFFMIPNSHQSPSRCWWMLVFYGILSYVFPCFSHLLPNNPQIIAIYCQLTPQIPRDAQVCFPCYLAFVAATGCGPPRVQRALAAMLLSQQKISFTGCEP
jgi:hypothetical protein